MEIKTVGNSLVVTTEVTMEDLKKLQARKPDALALTKEVDGKKQEYFRVAAGKAGSLNTFGATFSADTNTAPKKAMLTVDISGKSAEEDVKQYVAEKFGAAILNLREVEKKFQPALHQIAEEQEFLSGLINVVM